MKKVEEKLKGNLKTSEIISEVIRAFTHVNEGGVDVVGVLLSSFDWNDHSVELIWQTVTIINLFKGIHHSCNSTTYME